MEVVAAWSDVATDQKEEGLTNLVPVLLPTVAVSIGTNASPGCE